jgi:hypothetical protein
MDARQQRQAENELRFRSINEQIENVADELFAGEPPAPEAHDFLCECGDADCTAPLAMTLAEYERVRAHARRFLVAPEHVDTALERVVDRSARYWIVEKTDEAGELAESDDPRG